MSRFKKISAFTTMDLLTGMVIMSIIIAIIFYLMISTNKQISNYGKSRSEIIAYQLLKNDLNYNVQKAQVITRLPNGFLIKSNEKEVRYSLDNQLLIRQENQLIDTVFTAVEKVETNFISQKIKTEKEEVINRILITLFLGKKKLNLYIYKSYSIQNLINFQILDEY